MILRGLQNRKPKMADLEFIPTSDLIHELMVRETFLGIIIKSVNEITTHGNSNELHDDIGGFEMRCKNMSPHQALELLQAISSSIEDDLLNGENWKKIE
jgi:hypothetical protein